MALSLLPSCLVVLLCAGASLPMAAQQPVSDPTALVRRAIQHRLEADKTHKPLQYLIHTHDTKHDNTKMIVETRDGDVARLVALNGQPLAPADQQAELARLDNLAVHPELQEKRKRSEQKDAERVDHVLSELPDAMLYRYEGTEPCDSGKCYKLAFTPNPNWSAPDLESKLLRGVAGEVWIDTAAERLTRLHANFISDVSYLWGLGGKVYKGGDITLVQTRVVGDDWELTSLHLRANAEALIVKKVSLDLDETGSHYGYAPEGIDYKQAIDLLKALPQSAANR